MGVGTYAVPPRRVEASQHLVREVDCIHPLESRSEVLGARPGPRTQIDAGGRRDLASVERVAQGQEAGFGMPTRPLLGKSDEKLTDLAGALSGPPLHVEGDLASDLAHWMVRSGPLRGWSDRVEIREFANHAWAFGGTERGWRPLRYHV